MKSQDLRDISYPFQKAKLSGMCSSTSQFWRGFYALHVCRGLVFCLLLLLFCFLGRNYYYGPSERLVVEIAGAPFTEADVYYSAVPNGDFSCTRSSRLSVKDGELCMELPLESLGRLLICPQYYSAKILHGHYTNGPGKEGLKGNLYGDIKPKIENAAGRELSGITFCPVPTLPHIDGRVPFEKADGVNYLYQVEGCPCFHKHIRKKCLLVAVLVALISSIIVTWGLCSGLCSSRSRLQFAIYALMTAIALTMPLESSGPNTIMGIVTAPWFGGPFLSLVLVYPLYMFFKKVATIPNAKSVQFGAKICAGLLAFAYLLGSSFWSSGSWELLFSVHQLQVIKFSITFVGIFLLLAHALILLYSCLGTYAASLFEPSCCPSGSGNLWQAYLSRMKRSPFATSLITLLLAYMPLFMISYPSVFGYDIYPQLDQYVGYMVQPVQEHIPLNNHHPIAHTLILHASMWLGARLGAVHAGFAIYSCLQLVMLACSVSFFVYVLTQRGLKPLYGAFVVLYFVFHPVIQQFAFMTAKEILYTSFMLVFMACLYELYTGVQHATKQMWLVRAGLFVSLVGVMVMRNEGCYVMLLSLMILLVCARGGRHEIAVCLVLCLGYMAFFFSLMDTYGLNKNAMRESMSVPLQQIARVIKERPSAISLGELEAVHSVIDCPDLSAIYAPGCSDPVKSCFDRNASQQQLHNFFRAWGAIGMRNPEIYVQAFLNNYFLYFYPDKASTPLYVYSPGSIVNTWQVALSGTESDTAYIESMYRKISLYRACYTALFQLPVLRLLWWPCTVLWSFCVLLVYVVMRRNRVALTMLVLPAVAMLVPFVGPTNGDYIRYSYPFFAILPFVWLMSLSIFYSAQSTKKSYA